MKKIIPLLLVLGGCSSFQESHYSNQSTPEGNVIVATGRAADYAAVSNTSHNCPSCVEQTRESNAQQFQGRMERIFESVIIQAIQSNFPIVVN